jgi:hypothetical protein
MRGAATPVRHSGRSARDYPVESFAVLDHNSLWSKLQVKSLQTSTEPRPTKLGMTKKEQRRHDWKRLLKESLAREASLQGQGLQAFQPPEDIERHPRPKVQPPLYGRRIVADALSA